MELNVQVRDEAVRAWLRQATIELGPAGMRRLFRTLANQQLASTLENFEQQSFDGEPWEPLAESTQQVPYVGGARGAENILHPTGTHILQTISSEHTDVYARIFTPCPWAHVHNEGADLEGTAFGDITIPQRTFLGLSEADVDAIEEAVEWHLEQAING
jgi:phage virion morphogenesis protein